MAEEKTREEIMDALIPALRDFLEYCNRSGHSFQGALFEVSYDIEHPPKEWNPSYLKEDD